MAKVKKDMSFLLVPVLAFFAVVALAGLGWLVVSSWNGRRSEIVSASEAGATEIAVTACGSWKPESTEWGFSIALPEGGRPGERKEEVMLRLASAGIAGGKVEWTASDDGLRAVARASSSARCEEAAAMLAGLCECGAPGLMPAAMEGALGKAMLDASSRAKASVRPMAESLADGRTLMLRSAEELSSWIDPLDGSVHAEARVTFALIGGK